MLRFLSGTLLLVLLGAPSLHAQQIPSPFRYIETKHALGGFVGYLATGGGEVDLLRAPDAEIGPGSVPLLGLRYSIRFGGPVSGDISLAFGPGKRALYETDALPGDTIQRPLDTGEEADVGLLLLEGGVRFHITGQRTWNNLAPYLLASGGIVADVAGTGSVEERIPEIERFDFGPAFALGLGAGTDYFLNPRTSVRAEIRDQIWKIEVPVGFPVETGADRSRWTNNLGFSLGLAYHF